MQVIIIKSLYTCIPIYRSVPAAVHAPNIVPPPGRGQGPVCGGGEGESGHA